MLEGAAAAGYAVRTPTEPRQRGPLVVLASTDAEHLAARLVQRGFVCSPRCDGLRVAFHYYNLEEDADRLLEALRPLEALLVPA
jgi:selenocysteine lyase/cysteine desulfurase